MEWVECPISRQHDRKSFDCGNADLNAFLHSYARQSHVSGGAKTFVAVPVDDPTRVLGFYSVGPASLRYADTPDAARKGLARHDVPVFRLARLAVDQTLHGRGLGGALLVAAGKRCMAVAEQVGGVGLLIDAKDVRAANWYRSYGALRLEDRPLNLILTFATLRQALG